MRTMSKVESPIEIVAMALDPHSIGDILRGAGADHKVGNFLHLKLLNQILNQKPGAVSPVVVFPILSPLRITNNTLHKPFPPLTSTALPEHLGGPHS